MKNKLMILSFNLACKDIIHSYEEEDYEVMQLCMADSQSEALPDKFRGNKDISNLSHEEVKELIKNITVRIYDCIVQGTSMLIEEAIRDNLSIYDLEEIVDTL